MNLRFIMLLSASVATLWIASGMLIWFNLNTWEQRGQFGDMFGAINSLFSAMGFAGVVYAIYLQHRQIERVSRENRQSMHSGAFMVVYDILQNSNMRESRRKAMRELRGKPLDSWSAKQILHAEAVCQAYDAVGIMCRNGYVDARVVADSWGDSLRRCWLALSPLVEKYRVDREAEEFWDDFEWLASVAKTVRD